MFRIFYKDFFILMMTAYLLLNTFIQSEVCFRDAKDKNVFQRYINLISEGK